jgi:predicted transcriptional regulator
MAMTDPVSLPLLLPDSWWRRLQQVAEACATSPSEFVREVVEAEIVRRELLMEQPEDPSVNWLGEANAPSTTQIQ